MKVVPRIWCPEQTVVGSLGAEFAPLAAGRVTEPTDHIGVNSLAAESNSKTTQITRSQLFGRGVDFAESIFLLARPAESIFRDVKGERSPKRLRVWRVRALGGLARAMRGKSPERILRGTGFAYSVESHVRNAQSCFCCLRHLRVASCVKKSTVEFKTMTI